MFFDKKVTYICRVQLFMADFMSNYGPFFVFRQVSFNTKNFSFSQVENKPPDFPKIILEYLYSQVIGQFIRAPGFVFFYKAADRSFYVAHRSPVGICIYLSKTI
jgi:hypothetical protein